MTMAMVRKRQDVDVPHPFFAGCSWVGSFLISLHRQLQMASLNFQRPIVIAKPFSQPVRALSFCRVGT